MVVPPNIFEEGQVVFTHILAQLPAEDSFPVVVGNRNHWTLPTTVDRYDFAVPVLLEVATSQVIGFADPEPVLAEGYSRLVVAEGDTIGARGTLQWVQMCDDPGDEYGNFAPVPEGDYLVYLIATTGVPGADDGPQLPAELDPVTIVGGYVTSAATFTESVAGLSVYPQIHILDESGTVVGPQTPAGDVTLGIHVSADTPVQIEIILDATNCAGNPLPAGTYQVVRTLNETIGETNIVGVSDPVLFAVE